MEPQMNDRAVSTLIKACAAAVLVVAAAIAGWDALRSIAALQDAQLVLINTQRNLTDLTLDLFSASQRQAESLGRIDRALASLERNAGGDLALMARVRELEDRLLAYPVSDISARAEQADRIAVLVAAIQAAGEHKSNARRAAFSSRLHADLAAAALLCLALGALAAAWHGSKRRAASAGVNAGLMHETLEGLPFPLCVVNRDGQPILVNAAARELWNDEHQDRREWRRSDLEIRSENRTLYQALQSGYGRGRESVDIVAQDGASQRLLVTAMPLRDALHKVAGAFAVYVDAAAPAQANDFLPGDGQAGPLPALRMAHQNDDNDSGAAQPSHLFLLDQHGVIVAVNRPAIDISGIDFTGDNYLAVCDASAARGVPEAARIAAGIRAVTQGDVPTFSMEYVCRSGENFFWCRATVSRMGDTETPHIVVAHENITQHKATESALRESALSMRELAEHQESVREEERKRIAREIHDELGQQLLALKIDVSILQSQLSHVPEATAQLDGMLRSMSSLMQSMRAIINDLRPAVLDLGLHAAVEWQTREFQRKTGISCALMSDGEDIVLSDACATALFRTLQESLTNVSRHAHASHVDVQLYATDESLLMRVSDDGIGRLGQQDKPDAFGLRGMRERIGSLGGRLTITAAPDQGVTVTAVIPISPGQQLAQPGFDRRSAPDRRARSRIA
jgi:signal transduction histidine kinase